LKGIGEEYTAEGFDKLKEALLACESEGLDKVNAALQEGREYVSALDGTAR
jgi:hypothetical protein